MSFSSDINDFRKKANKNAEKVFKGTVLDMFGRIVKRTPVGNPDLWQSKPPPGYVGGSLRAHWQVGLNKINLADPNGNQEADIAKTKLKDTVFITNNLPYALAIEHGHSTQIRPGGMVKVTVNEFKNIVKANAIKVKK